MYGEPPVTGAHKLSRRHGPVATACGTDTDGARMRAQTQCSAMAWTLMAVGLLLCGFCAELRGSTPLAVWLVV